LQWTIGRGVCLGIGSLALAASIWLAWQSVAWERRFYAWLNETPPSIRVDPASTAEHEVVFDHTCTVAHSHRVYLSAVMADGTPAPPEAWPALPSAHVTIEPHDDPSGARVLQPTGYGVEEARLMNDPNGIMLVEDMVSHEGRYRLRVALTQAINAPAGVAYEIAFRNDLCGCEQWPGIFARWLAILFGVPGLLLAIPSAIMIVRSPRPDERATPPDVTHTGEPGS
jgi:hypothetical protein